MRSKFVFSFFSLKQADGFLETRSCPYLQQQRERNPLIYVIPPIYPTRLHTPYQRKLSSLKQQVHNSQHENGMFHMHPSALCSSIDKCTRNPSRATNRRTSHTRGRSPPLTLLLHYCITVELGSQLLKRIPKNRITNRRPGKAPHHHKTKQASRTIHAPNPIRQNDKTQPAGSSDMLIL